MLHQGLFGGSALTCHGAEHDPDNPEFSILAHRLSSKCIHEGVKDSDLKSWDLADLTKVGPAGCSMCVSHSVLHPGDPGQERLHF